MGENKIARECLEEIYGKKDMFKEARIEERLAKEKPKIKSYKQFKERKRYTAKTIQEKEKIMNYHHLVHKSERRWNKFRKWSSNKWIST